MTALVERPIFIVGHPRSGTTLLRFLLSSHPRIYIPEETGFIPFLIKKGQIEADLSLTQVKRIVEHIGQLNRLWRGIVKDISALYEALPEPKLQYVLDALYRQQIAEYDAARWGDKTPVYVHYISTIERIFPSAQFVHMIRDGRDAAVSAQEKWPDRRLYMDTYYLLRNWVKNVESGQTAGRYLGPGRYLEVHYERLVREPQHMLEQVCRFLDESFHPNMLNHPRFARQIGPGPQGHVEAMQPISTSSIGRWKTQMTPFDQKIANRLAGQTLSALGYELAEVHALSATENAKRFLLAVKYHLTDTTRSLLYASGALTLNRGMR
jgi:hypothetical protein